VQLGSKLENKKPFSQKIIAFSIEFATRRAKITNNVAIVTVILIVIVI